ncbi:MAG: hypothetical protein V3R33_08870 [Anaerolineales bacterium]
MSTSEARTAIVVTAIGALETSAWSRPSMAPASQSPSSRSVDLRAEDSLPQYSPTPRTSPQSIQSWKNIQKESPQADKSESQYHPGQKIKHAKWGEGLVLNSVLQDDDEIVDIFFEGVGKKKLIASLADLKIIDS